MKLDEVQNMIKSKAEFRVPVHQCHIALLKTRISDWKSRTEEQMIIHLFAEQSDATMSKVAMEILASGSPNVTALWTKVAKIENSLWYKGGRRNFEKEGLKVRFCKRCGSNIHNEDQCWGACAAFGMRGHCAEWCQRKGLLPGPGPATTPATGS